jgi:16S rRNA (guanine966-N2)-methyltransferase
VPRIVAGLAKGRRLATPAQGTRPTSDRAREALFNSLYALLDLDGTQVLDIFAGTGAVGLEALSRGAQGAVFVESERAAGEVLRSNIEVVGLPGAVVRRRSASAYLAAGPTDGPFDLVFADPPYDFEQDALTALLTSLATDGWLAEDAVVVVERSSRGSGPEWPDGIEALRDRRYGAGVLWYGRRR